jgi:ElaB/YqjD/DUF883 family membrane-anchored ribosome-binding protein
MRKSAIVCVLSLGVVACTPHDKQETRQELRKTGDAVKKELKNDAAFVKQEALKAREETQKGVKKLKKDLDDKSDSSH